MWRKISLISVLLILMFSIYQKKISDVSVVNHECQVVKFKVTNNTFVNWILPLSKDSNLVISGIEYIDDEGRNSYDIVDTYETMEVIIRPFESREVYCSFYPINDDYREVKYRVAGIISSHFVSVLDTRTRLVLIPESEGLD